jgi:hypothetical protein
MLSPRALERKARISISIGLRAQRGLTRRAQLWLVLTIIVLAPLLFSGVNALNFSAKTWMTIVLRASYHLLRAGDVLWRRRSRSDGDADGHLSFQPARFAAFGATHSTKAATHDSKALQSGFRLGDDKSAASQSSRDSDLTILSCCLRGRLSAIDEGGELTFGLTRGYPAKIRFAPKRSAVGATEAARPIEGHASKLLR